jgi:hypothetical protein
MDDQGNGMVGEPLRAPVFALTRESWTFSALWDHCLAAFQREWVGLSLAALLTLVIVYGVAFAGGLVGAIAEGLGGGGKSPVVGGAIALLQVVLQYGAQAALSLGLMRVALDVLHGERAEVSRLFGQLHKAPGYLLAQLGLMLLVLLPFAALGGLGFLTYRLELLGETGLFVAGFLAFLVLLVPLIYFTLPLYFLAPELALQERPEVLQSVRACYRVADGHRLEMLGVAMLGGALLFAGVLLCCVGVFPALGLMTLLSGGLYAALRRGTALDERP